MRVTRHVVLALLATALPMSAGAQSLSEQINAVSAAQDAQDARIAAAEAAAAAAQQQQAAEADRLALLAERAQARIQQEKLTAALHAQARDQAYQDQLRSLDLQQRNLQLEQEQIATGRENDMIDHALKREDAQADLVQSQADATRDEAEGDKTLLSDVGQADVNATLPSGMAPPSPGTSK